MTTRKRCKTNLEAFAKLKEKLGMTDDELISHALVLLQIAVEKADSEGTIWIGKDDDAVGLCLRKSPPSA